MPANRDDARVDYPHVNMKTQMPEMVSGPPLVFVYDTGSGAWNAFTDSIYRICAPSGEYCALLVLTASSAAARRRWKAFVSGMRRSAEFLYSDELTARYGVRGVPLPALFERSAKGVRLLIGAEQLQWCTTDARPAPRTHMPW